MRTAALLSTVFLVGSACVSTPSGGALGEGASFQPRIAGIDSGFPPRVATVQLDRDVYVALLLIAPGHSATLLYPPDSTTNNRLPTGTHPLRFDIPTALAETDSQRLARIREAQRNPARRGATRRTMTPIPPSTPTYLLLVTSPQPLVYQRMIEKTGGVSIPNIDDEALNAVAKAIKSTLENEPREWAGFYQPVELRRYR